MLVGQATFRQSATRLSIVQGWEVVPKVLQSGFAAAIVLLLKIGRLRVIVQLYFAVKAGMKPSMVFSSVDFPKPLTPLMAIFWPLSTWNVSGFVRASS